MADLSTHTQTQLAYRPGDGMDVTLVRLQSACHHPFAYRDFSTFDHEDTRLAA